MLVNELHLTNIRCFGDEKIDFKATGARPAARQATLPRQAVPGDAYRWVTLLGENGAGKSTVLQSLALLLAGPEGAPQLLPRPVGWLRDENKYGKLSIRIRQGDKDPGRFGATRVSKEFGYSFFVTGQQKLSIRGKTFTEPAVVESTPDRNLSWLRENAFTSKGQGWFAAGYGAYRRLTRSSQVLVPSLEPQVRSANFRTQFDEDESLSTFERWMVYLDYRIAKEQDKGAERRREIGVEAINRLLPSGVHFDSVSADGKINFRIGDRVVPTIGMSDGYRSILALAGDLVWRLMQAFPKSDDPLQEEGVVLIDELDIHLHPKWQRSIADLLRSTFPRIQFFVGTHSAFIAAGAGPDALTLRLSAQGDLVTVRRIEPLAWRSVDRILQHDAFGLDSVYSPEAQKKIDRYQELRPKKRRSAQEEREFQGLLPFMAEARPIGGPPEPGSLDARIEAFLEEQLP